MVELIKHRPEDIEKAARIAEEMGSLNNSILKGQGNKAGVLAELALARHIGAERPDEVHHGWDLKLHGKTIEVKTKRRTVMPRPDYDVSIAKTSMHQKSDLYAFVSIWFEEKTKDGFYKGLRGIYLCGFYPNLMFKRDARFVKKGEVDQKNWFTSRADMYNMEICQLLCLQKAICALSSGA